MSLEVWTMIIQKPTVIPPSLMVLFFNKILTDSADSDRMVRIKNKISSKFGVFFSANGLGILYVYCTIIVRPDGRRKRESLCSSFPTLDVKKPREGAH